MVRVAVVGSGPAGFFATDALLSAGVPVEVDLIERLPTPGGLVRLGVAPDQSYPAKLQKKVDAGGYRYRVVNAGVSGDTSAQGLNRLGLVRAEHPEIVVVALGGNDGLRGLPVAEIRRNLEAIIDRLTEDRARLVLAGIEVPPNYGPEYTAAFRGMFRDLARELLREVSGHLFRKGKAVTLFVNDFNAPAVALYEGLGFRRVGINRALIW